MNKKHAYSYFYLIGAFRHGTAEEQCKRAFLQFFIIFDTQAIYYYYYLLSYCSIIYLLKYFFSINGRNVEANYLILLFIFYVEAAI